MTMLKAYRINIPILILAAVMVFSRCSFAADTLPDDNAAPEASAVAIEEVSPAAAGIADSNSNKSAQAEHVFELSVIAQNQPSSVNFVNFNPGDSPQSNEVLVEIKSNLGRQYQVLQNVTSRLANIDGQRIPLKNITAQTLPLSGTKGFLKIPDKTPLKRGHVLLYISDLEGSSDKFKINYELTAPENLIPGNYLSGILYTLSEI
ncbi:MAG: hypothetical protein PHS66_05955 [Candidatus Omnitrophica bacterium]|nr:hypothetical protein [Candidatus Omnitrophota bacterium]